MDSIVGFKDRSFHYFYNIEIMKRKLQHFISPISLSRVNAFWLIGTFQSVLGYD